MYQDRIILCGASAYTKKYYLGEDFSSLPSSIQDELKIMCVLFTEDVGGTIELYFDEEETTGISIISNSQPTADDMYYDLQGRRVSHPTTGVYILNGKKIIVK
jgi:hypothetical protein